MVAKSNEQAFEDEVEAALLASGGYKLLKSGFDPALGLWPDVLTGFVRESQPKEWAALEQIHGKRTAEVVLDAFCKAAAGERGVLEVLRHGFKCYGKLLRAAYFRPATGLNPDTLALYDANKLTVTRQLRFSAKTPGKSVDLVLGLNGIPIVTMELKNPATNQTFNHAIRQYREDRDPAEPIFAFKQRSLVHFAVDPDEAFMTTHLAGAKTRFLPFNRGNARGAGNPPSESGHRTAYLWDEVLQRDSLLDLIQRFLHLDVKEERDTKTRKMKKREAMIFPRYHQYDAVRLLEQRAAAEGPGHNYLVQHSAGSGKSNSIAWLSHRLAQLHDGQDKKVFDTVIVMTDRRVLDRQLQDTVYQFEHKHGVVEKIDKDSAQLARALKGGTPIIITTLQKFPFVAERLDGETVGHRRYAVIVDEAHSGQSGQAASEAKGVLAGEHIKAEAKRRAEEDDLSITEEQILQEVLKRGKQPNVSFFAFTATPKHKTIQVFGSRPEGGGPPAPSSLYSMRQAIEEGFILDVLQGYTTYELYYKLAKTASEDKTLPKREAARALARFVSLHPHNLDQKSEVIVEHFRRNTRHKIGGRAKAMVVTENRLHAVRYKQAIDRYVVKHGLSDEVKVLVAFSGTVEDEDGERYTEASMNGGMGDDQIPIRFATDEFNMLVVADKFQTGFDQPLLQTMYVDKRLAGIQAVQTLSRLNRTTAGKEDTFVLDFRNKREEILDSFQPFYEVTGVTQEADPQQLYKLQGQLNAAGVYHNAELDSFSTAFFGGSGLRGKPSAGQHAAMNAALDAAVDRFNELSEDEKENRELQEQFRGRLSAFCSLYAFLAQVVPFEDTDLEQLYAYGKPLLRKLPRDDAAPPVDLREDVALRSYRLQKREEGAIQLQKGQDG